MVRRSAGRSRCARRGLRRPALLVAPPYGAGGSRQDRSIARVRAPMPEAVVASLLRGRGRRQSTERRGASALVHATSNAALGICTRKARARSADFAHRFVRAARDARALATRTVRTRATEQCAVGGCVAAPAVSTAERRSRLVELEPKLSARTLA